MCACACVRVRVRVCVCLESERDGVRGWVWHNGALLILLNPLFWLDCRYFTLVSMIRENLLGSRQHFKKHFEQPITAGQFADATKAARKAYQHRMTVLKRVLRGAIHRCTLTDTDIAIPRRREYVVMVRLTPPQRSMYKTILQKADVSSGKQFIALWKLLSHVWNAPTMLWDHKAARDLLGSMLAQLPQGEPTTDTVDRFLQTSGKLEVTIAMVREIALRGERVLLFCSTIKVLQLVAKALTLVPLPNFRTRQTGNWRLNREILVIQGKDSAEARRDKIYSFNSDDSDACVMLISHKVRTIGFCPGELLVCVRVCAIACTIATHFPHVVWHNYGLSFGVCICVCA